MQEQQLKQQHFIGWSEFGRLCTKLYNDTWSLNLDAIVGIGRGGLMIAAYLAHKLDVPLYSVFVRHVRTGGSKHIEVDDIQDLAQFTGSSILLVEDWLVHGQAINVVKQHLPNFVNVHTLALVAHPDNEEDLDYVGLLTRDEIHFPYDW
jgi:hypoxanthine phosphoribosyltransferase